jgi:flagellin
MLSIQTNVNSLTAQQNLNVNNAFQAKTIQQLTSGYRINAAGDDAAGLAVANKFRSSVAELTQGVANANDGIGQLQIIDGGLTNISHMLDRLKTLATQSASTTFTGSRTTVNNEFQALLLEINRQAANVGLSTAAGGGTFLTKMNVYIGGGNAANAVNSNAQVSVDLAGSAVDSAGLGISTASVLGGGVGFALNTAKSLNDPGSMFATAQNFSVNYIDSNGVAQNRTVTYANSATETGAKVVSDLNAALAAQGISGVTTQIGSDGQLQWVGSGSFTVSTTAAAGAAVTNAGNTGTMSLVNTARHYLQSGTFAAYADGAGTAAVDVLTFTDASTNKTTQVTLNKTTANTLANAVITLNAQFKAQGMALSALDDGAGHISFQSAGDFRISDANTAASGGGTGAIFTAAGDQGATSFNAQASATGAALAAIDAIATAITSLGLVQGRIGAGENMLSYASSLAQSQITNFNSAQAQIRDTDIAAAAANLTKAQVLQQASIAAMAQANSAPQQVLALLRA